MTENKTELTTLHAIRFQVDSLDESLAFYKKLGCIVEKVESSNYSISAYLKFSVHDTIMIQLFKDFRKVEKLTEKEKLPTFELAVNQRAENYYDEIFGMLAENGIEYSNCKDPEKMICMAGSFVDNNNLNWELIYLESELENVYDS